MGSQSGVRHFAETKVASGSLIAAAMRELGEDGAVDELEWADREPDPCELPVMDTQKLIEAHRCRVHSGMYNHVSVVDEICSRLHKKTQMLQPAPPQTK